MGGCGSTSAIKIPHEKRYRRAIKLYQVTEVKSLTNLINRNKCFESGESPLTLAAQEGHEAVVQSLVVSGADVNKLDNNGRGPLHIAVQLNDEETVEILLGANANPNKYDAANSTPLHLAGEGGNCKIVRRLLKAGSNVNESQRGLSPLVIAVMHGNAECVEELLRHGADPNVLDTRGNTLLHVAIRNKDVMCTRLLLEYKASPHLPSHDNTSLLCLACLTGCPDTVRLLVDLAGWDITVFRDDEPPPIIAATVVGNADCVDILLSVGASPDTPDKRGHTALQMAATIVIDSTKESFYSKYFANLYRQYSRYDVGEVSHENSTRCAMSLVTGGANASKVWERFSALFPNPEGISFEQMVLCEVLIQCYGFEGINSNTLKTFVGKLLEVREHGLLKLLYSAGVDPTWNEESKIGISTDENDRELYRWIKKLRTNPRSLKDLCRKKIRCMLSWNVLHLAHKMPILSEDMKEYVCIMDTDHYSVIIEELPQNNNQEVVINNCTAAQHIDIVRTQQVATDGRHNVTTEDVHNVPAEEKRCVVTDGHPNVTAEGHHHVTTDGHPNVTAEGHHHVTTDGHPNVTAEGHHHVTTDGHPNVTAESGHHVTTDGHPNVTAEGGHGLVEGGSHHVTTEGHHHVTTQGHHHMTTDGHDHVTTEGHHHVTTDGHHHMTTDGHHHVTTDGHHHVTTDGHHHVTTDGPHHVTTDGHNHATIDDHDYVTTEGHDHVPTDVRHNVDIQQVNHNGYVDITPDIAADTWDTFRSVTPEMVALDLPRSSEGDGYDGQGLPHDHHSNVVQNATLNKMERGNGAICTLGEHKTSNTEIITEDTIRETVT